MNAIVILCDTLRRDHCGPYHRDRSLNQCWSAQQPGWVVPTPNLDRLAARGTVFDNCFTGSTPCMPARRDLYTGRYEFLWRGWGPLHRETCKGWVGESKRKLKEERFDCRWYIHTGGWPPADLDWRPHLSAAKTLGGAAPASTEIGS